MRDGKVFQSSMIQSGSYDSATQTLELTFMNGDVYTAEDVPPSVWEALKQASSPGRHFHQVLRPLGFNFTKS